MSSCQKLLNTTNFLSVMFVLGLTKEVLKSCYCSVFCLTAILNDFSGNTEQKTI